MRSPPYFNPLRPWGRRHLRLQPSEVRLAISTHSARGGGDSGLGPCQPERIISTHSARGGGDLPWPLILMLSSIFQPTPPVGAETPQPAGPLSRRLYFNPLRPWGRRRALRKGHKIQHRISTHSARGGGDKCETPPDGELTDFNPLRPWGRRPGASRYTAATPDFNPLRPWGRRRKQHQILPGLLHFNPLRPWGRRQRRPFRP